MTDFHDLPDAYKDARAEDEAFWQGQEKRIQGMTGQPCCTLSGVSTTLIAMPGHFAVVIHGEDECAACFLHEGPGAVQFFCTGLEEEHFVSGNTEGPLRRCLELVAEEVVPDAIFVLGACPVEVIGDRFETVVEDVGRAYPDIPMVPMHTSGLKVGTQAAMLDWIFSELSKLPLGTPALHASERLAVKDLADRVAAFLGTGRPGPEAAAPSVPADRTLTLIGLPQESRVIPKQPEFVGALRAAGLGAVACLPYGAGIDEWRAAGAAHASFVVDRSLYPKTVKQLERVRGQRVVEIPLPSGIAQTAETYRRIGEVFDAVASLESATAPAREVAEAAVEAFRARFGGLRLALGLRMLNNYQADQLAYQGLGDVAALEELGFELTLMVQGPPEKAARMERVFKRYGLERPFQMFPEPWTLSEHIGGGRFDVAILADHCRAEARKAGVPMVVSRQLDTWYEGVPRNLTQLTTALTGVL